MIEPGTRVTHTPTGRWGVTAPPLPGMLDCNEPGEITVVYEGTTVGEGTLESELEARGPEAPVADFKACGAGRGTECCIFMTVGAKGTCCERHTSFRWSILFRQHNMCAQRHPTEVYPACQKFHEEAKS